MSYREIMPSHALSPYIEAYWFFEDLCQAENHRILPDGCADIIFNLGSSTPTIAQASIAVTGMMTKPALLAFDTSTSLMGIRFKTGMLSCFTKIPLYKVKNEIVTITDLIPTINANTLDRIATQTNSIEQLKIVEQILLKLLNTNNSWGDPLISAITTYLQNTVVPLPPPQLARDHNISLRQLERRFKHQTGTTLKEFANITRFNQTIKTIQHCPAKSLLDIAFDHGYFDHAHLTNDIKRFSGQIPSDFR
ncbi:MAG: AraC family transcriptional regulator [Marinilabiliaceae bacterium]|nr:AraC family transcriptional regulator [Marinilabiliaceae bacterium]